MSVIHWNSRRINPFRFFQNWIQLTLLYHSVMLCNKCNLYITFISVSDLCGFLLNRWKRLISTGWTYQLMGFIGMWKLTETLDGCMNRFFFSVLSVFLFCSTPDLGYDFETNSGCPFNYFSYGAAVSEVEIDCLTGSHKVTTTIIVSYDCMEFVTISITTEYLIYIVWLINERITYLSQQSNYVILVCAFWLAFLN